MICHPMKYPIFNLCESILTAQFGKSDRNLDPAVYPYFDLYPEVWTAADISGVNVGAMAMYPVFNLCKCLDQTAMV
jgi:hypothetical protein